MADKTHISWCDATFNTGKPAAGRQLDGREWTEVPG